MIEEEERTRGKEGRWNGLNEFFGDGEGQSRLSSAISEFMATAGGAISGCGEKDSPATRGTEGQRGV
jgi:hypothetical protein